MIFVSFSIEKTIIPHTYLALFVPTNLPIPTKSNLYLANSLAAAVSEPALYRLLTFHVANLMYIFPALFVPSINRAPRQAYVFRNNASFYSEELSKTHPIPELEDRP